MVELGNRIRVAREQSSFTQESLAEALGVSRTAVSRWERGEIEPGIQKFVLLAKCLNVSADQLLGLETTGIASRVGITLEAELLLANFIVEIRKTEK